MPRTLLASLKQKYQHTDIENKVDQVVAMIFRITPQQQIQLLFLQRAYSQDDHYSGDICFPGGYREKGETCLTAAIRESFEETQLKLSSKQYIGALQFIFTTRMAISRVRGNSKDKMQLYMGILMFEINYQISQTIKPNQKQIRSYRWLNINHFLKGSNSNITTWSHQYPLRPDKKTIVLFPAFHIGMDRQLYGLTLYTTMLFVVTIDRMIQQGSNIDVEIEKKFFDVFCHHCIDIKVQGDDKQQLSVARKIYLENRVGFLRSKL